MLFFLSFVCFSEELGKRGGEEGGQADLGHGGCILECSSKQALLSSAMGPHWTHVHEQGSRGHPGLSPRSTMACRAHSPDESPLEHF